MDYRTYALSEHEKQKNLMSLSELLSRHEEILFAYVHGSFLEEGPFRDLDMAVYLRPESFPLSRFRYEDSLGQEIINELVFSFPVDLHILNSASIFFKYHVFQGHLLVDRDPETRLAIIAYVVARYLDMKPILQHHVKEAFGSEARS